MAITGEKSTAIVIVLCPEMPHNPDMKTPFRLCGLVGWMGRCGVALVALAFCASALADPSKNVVATPKEQANKMQTTTQRVSKKQFYIMISGSGIPQPIDRVAGPIATTAIPMIVIGNGVGE